jgi:hypothetical protein
VDVANEMEEPRKGDCFSFLETGEPVLEMIGNL